MPRPPTINITQVIDAPNGRWIWFGAGIVEHCIQVSYLSIKKLKLVFGYAHWESPEPQLHADVQDTVVGAVYVEHPNSEKDLQLAIIAETFDRWESLGLLWPLVFRNEAGLPIQPNPPSKTYHAQLPNYNVLSSLTQNNVSLPLVAPARGVPLIMEL